LVSPRNFEPWFLYFGQNLEKKLPRSSKNIENFSL
jgi:hypothetical protein